MISDTVYKITFTAPAVCKKEIYRYSGYYNTKAISSNTEQLIDECIKESEGKISYNVCWAELPVEINNDSISLGNCRVHSTDLSKGLSGCKTSVVFAATTGIETDRLIAKYSRISPVKSLVFQAIGTERAEALCDEFCRYIAKEKDNLYLKPRFSPGYGDLPLEFQKDIFNILNPSKHIGLTLNDSLLMSPSKSVTAIIGITDIPQKTETLKCEHCSYSASCEYRGE